MTPQQHFDAARSRDGVPFGPVRNIRGAWVAPYADMGSKGRRAVKPFTVWAALRRGKIRYGFETRRDAVEFARS